MATYQIIPSAEIIGHEIIAKMDVGMDLKECRRLCNVESDCEAFVWDEKNSLCSLKKDYQDAIIFQRPGVMLYIKKENSSYWMLWVFLVILGAIIAVSMCKRSRS